MTKAKRSVFIGVALGVAACATAAGQAGRPLLFCSEGDPEGFYPAIHTTGTTFDASSRQIYDPLLKSNSDGGLEYGLAESYEISDDGLSYVFVLRQGVPFHTRPWFTPTREFTAADVVFSLDRQRQSDAGYEYWDSMGMGELLAEIVEEDDYTVRITLTEPNTTLLAMLAMDFAVIVSKEYYEQLLRATRDEGDALAEFDTRPIGTGPYQFEAYTPGAQIVYRAHPGYWRGPAPTETVIFAITPDATARFRRLRAGSCDVMALPSPAAVNAMRAHPDITLHEKPGLTVSYLAWHTQRPPFNSPDVRRAMWMAIDNVRLLAALYRGTARAAKGPIPFGMRFHADDLEGHEYDPEAARQLLEGAGISGRLSTTIYYPSDIQRGYMPSFSLAAQLIQRDLRAIGVDADLEPMLWTEFLEFARDDQREQGAVIFGWTADFGDPETFVGSLLTCGNSPGLNAAAWCDTEFDELVLRARSTTDPVERAALFRRIQQIFIEQAPWVPIAHALILDPVRREVCDYEANPYGLHEFYGVRFCEEGR